ncbi:hypothetical protein D3C86_1844890 [compost metagenome]
MTVTRPEVASAGTSTVSSVGEAAVMVATAPLKATALSAMFGPKFSPIKEITMPAPPT